MATQFSKLTQPYVVQGTGDYGADTAGTDPTTGLPKIYAANPDGLLDWHIGNDFVLNTGRSSATYDWTKNRIGETSGGAFPPNQVAAAMGTFDYRKTGTPEIGAIGSPAKSGFEDVAQRAAGIVNPSMAFNATKSIQDATPNARGGLNMDLSGSQQLAQTASTIPGSAAAAKPEVEPGMGGVGTGISIANAAVDQIGQVAQAKKNIAVDAYLNDVDYWNKQGKWWFDKNADYAPTFEEFNGSGAPSAVNAIREGSMTGNGILDSTLGGFGKGAATGASIGFAVGLPAGGVGAIPAAIIGGAIGAVVGTVGGLIIGIMEWSSAKKEDAKQKERAYNEYKKQLKEWTYHKNILNEKNRVSTMSAITQKQQGTEELGMQRRQAAKKESSAKNETLRNRMINVLSNLGGAKAQAQAQRQARWS